MWDRKLWLNWNWCLCRWQFKLDVNYADLIREHKGCILLPTFDEQLPNFWPQLLSLTDIKRLVWKFRMNVLTQKGENAWQIQKG